MAGLGGLEEIWSVAKKGRTVQKGAKQCSFWTVFIYFFFPKLYIKKSFFLLQNMYFYFSKQVKSTGEIIMMHVAHRAVMVYIGYKKGCPAVQPLYSLAI